MVNFYCFCKTILAFFIKRYESVISDLQCVLCANSDTKSYLHVFYLHFNSVENPAMFCA